MLMRQISAYKGLCLNGPMIHANWLSGDDTDLSRWKWEMKALLNKMSQYLIFITPLLQCLAKVGYISTPQFIELILFLILIKPYFLLLFIHHVSIMEYIRWWWTENERLLMQWICCVSLTVVWYIIIGNIASLSSRLSTSQWPPGVHLWNLFRKK